MPDSCVQDHVVVAPEVAEALSSGRGVVALESTLIAHGLPRPRNREVALELEAIVREGGAVPATIALVGGRIQVGLDARALDVIADDASVAKLSTRDLGVAIASGSHGATTVAATSWVAAAVGIGVFATGGLGGVHRGARDSWDESADLPALQAHPVTVVCAGVKSILDVGATLERLETLGVPVIGYRTDRFPGFYLSDSGQGVPWQVQTPEQVAAVMRVRRDLGQSEGIVLANPLPEDEQMDPQLHDALLFTALDRAEAQGIRGKDVTPFVLEYFHANSGGESLRANIAIVANNAALAADIAVAAATPRG